MKDKKFLKALALLLMLCLALSACAPAAEAPAEPEAPAATEAPAAEAPAATEAPAEEEPAEEEPAEEEPAEAPKEEPKGWEETLDGLYEHLAANQEKFAPEQRELASGVSIQRTPADSAAYNTRLLKADERGCSSCHVDFEATVENMSSFTQPNFYRHLEFDDELGLEVTVRQCYVCHGSNTFGDLEPMIHGLHKNAAFTAMGGDCWSCHYLDENNEMVLWDLVKYDVLKGVTKIANVQGEFSYRQDVLTEDFFAMNWMYNAPDFDRISKHEADEPNDPAADGIYEEWTIEVVGEVENPVTFTLAELMEQAPIVKTTSAYQCVLNPLAGPFVENVEITGIPISWLLEQAQVREGMEIYYCGYPENMAYPLSIAELEEHPGYLVYEINGKPIEYENGYPVVAWFMQGGAAEGRKNCTRIEVVSTKAADVKLTTRGTRYADGTFDNVPNIGLCHFMDGQVISGAEAYTFEGYASSFDRGIAAIEISFDNGATWTRFDTSDSNDDCWVYWYFTWQPEAPGSYLISVRAVAKDGYVTDEAVRKLITVQ